jgi:pimeloyl-ACP methyl ester carboxylesterase
MNAATFWTETGVVEDPSSRGFDVVTPERLSQPRSWADDGEHVAEQLRSHVARPLTVVAGSNGCSTAARIAIAHPDLVERIALCWPVTVGQDHVLEQSLAERISGRSGEDVAGCLLGGETLRGVRDAELMSLVVPVAIMASEPENLVHRRSTTTALLQLWPDAVELPAMPEPPMARFQPVRFVEALTEWLVS